MNNLLRIELLPLNRYWSNYVNRSEGASSLQKENLAKIFYIIMIFTLFFVFWVFFLILSFSSCHSSANPVRTTVSSDYEDSEV